jgi:hypothetical protein
LDTSVIINNFTQITRVISSNQGSAEHQVFKLFLESPKYQRMVFIHDSMIMNQYLDISSIETVQFFWHFTNHIKQWDIIKEKTYNGISHTELIKQCIARNYNNSPLFQEYTIRALRNKKEWCGAFGACCVITKQCLEYMEKHTGFTNIFTKATTKRLRCVNESIFALVCHYCYPDIDFSNSINGLYYNGNNTPFKRNTPSGFDNLKWCCVGTYVSKISFGR